MTDLEKQAEEAVSTRIASALTGDKIIVKLETPDGVLGYTNGNLLPKEICISSDAKMYQADDETQMVLRRGVLTHEILHQLCTDFEAYEKLLLLDKADEQQIHQLFNNLVEDPAIENFADWYVGGMMLKSLRCTIKHFYNLSANIEDAPTAIEQLIGALVHFGDMGLLKGNFTFPEARQKFLEVAGLFNDAVENPVSAERALLAKEIYLKCKDLWDALDENGKKEVAERLSMGNPETMTANHGSPAESGEDAGGDCDGDFGGETSEGSSSSKSSSSKASSARKQMLKSMSTGTPSSDDSGEDAADGAIEGQDSSSDADSTDTKEMSEKEMSEIAKDIKEESAKEMASIKKAAKDVTHDDRCNHTETRKSLPLYNEIKSKYGSTINSLKKSLKEIFKAEEEAAHMTSGKYNIMRGSIGCTAAMFDKKRTKAVTKDVAVMLAIDNSGSMSRHNKIDTAVASAIIIAEALADLGIPMYVMGYTARGYMSPDHYHYVKWKNSVNERQSLTAMCARDGNCDSMSIKAASDLLAKRPETKKILLVLTDGLPTECSENDVKDVVKSIVKDQQLFVIGIGDDCRPDRMQEMYGHRFVLCPKINELQNAVKRNLVRMMQVENK